jgi:hypothetical protein
MKQSIKFNLNHKPLDFIFILSLLCIFAIGSLLVVVLGANIYKEITSSMDSNFQFRTPLSYISTKVRQNDDYQSVRVEEKEGTDALVLSRTDGGEICETWIYEYDQSLCEVYITKGTSFQLADGIAMIPSYGLEISLENNLLKLQAKDQQGMARSLTISLRTQQGGDSL